MKVLGWQIALIIAIWSFVVNGQTTTPSPSCSPTGGTERIVDGTFEAGDPWPAWTTQTSTNFFTPNCTVAVCGNGGPPPTAGPFAGLNWAWFGGAAAVEQATLGQTYTVPVAGPATLSFQMWVGAVNTPFTDTLTVSVDGSVVQTFTEPAAPEAGYTLRTIPLNFATTGNHTILFSYNGPTLFVANFNVDNVSLIAGGGCPTPSPTPTPTPLLSGRVLFENIPAPTPPRPVPGVAINAAGAPPLATTTNATGIYSLTGFGPGAYTVTPSRTSMTCSTANGIFANDASLIAQHVIGLVTLNLTQRRAADVAGLGPDNISTFEAGLIARWIVCLNDGNQSGQWKFTPVNRTYPSVTGNTPNQDYAALLMGDVSGDWSSTLMLLPQTISMFDSLKVAVPKVDAARGTQVTLPLTVGNLMGRGLTAYQFDVEYDPSVVTPAAVAADLTGTLSEGMTLMSNVTEPGLLKVVVFGATPVRSDGVYVNLRFVATGRPGTVSPIAIRGFRANDGTMPVLAANGAISVRPRIRGNSGE